MNIIRCVVSLVVFVATCMIAQSTWAADFKFNLANEYSPNSLDAENQLFFIDRVEQNSDGRIEITPHFGGALGYSSSDHYAAVRSGAVELASTPVGSMAGFSPIFAVQTLPFLAPTIPQSEALWQAASPHYEKVLNEGNQTLLFGTPSTPNCIWAESKITAVDDLKGLKTRTFDISSTKAMEAGGLAPIQLTWADVLQALSTGTIDAVMTTVNFGVDANLWDVGAKYCNGIGYGMGVAVVTMNQDAYERLPEDLQSVLRQAAATTEEQAWERSVEALERNKRIIEDSGGEYVEMPQSVMDHLIESSAPLIEGWSNEVGPAGEKILSQYYKKVRN